PDPVGSNVEPQATTISGNPSPSTSPIAGAAPISAGIVFGHPGTTDPSGKIAHSCRPAVPNTISLRPSLKRSPTAMLLARTVPALGKTLGNPAREGARCCARIELARTRLQMRKLEVLSRLLTEAPFSMPPPQVQNLFAADSRLAAIKRFRPRSL